MIFVHLLFKVNICGIGRVIFALFISGKSVLSAAINLREAHTARNESTYFTGIEKVRSTAVKICGGKKALVLAVHLMPCC